MLQEEETRRVAPTEDAPLRLESGLLVKNNSHFWLGRFQAVSVSFNPGGAEIRIAPTEGQASMGTAHSLQIT